MREKNHLGDPGVDRKIILRWIFRKWNVRVWTEMNEMGGLCSTYGERRGVTGFWWGNLRERNHLGDPGVDRKIILRWIFRKWNVGVWTGSSWLRLGTSGGHVWMR